MASSSATSSGLDAPELPDIVVSSDDAHQAKTRGSQHDDRLSGEQPATDVPKPSSESPMADGTTPDANEKPAATENKEDDGSAHSERAEDGDSVRERDEDSDLEDAYAIEDQMTAYFKDGRIPAQSRWTPMLRNRQTVTYFIELERRFAELEHRLEKLDPKPKPQKERAEDERPARPLLNTTPRFMRLAEFVGGIPPAERPDPEAKEKMHILDALIEPVRPLPNHVKGVAMETPLKMSEVTEDKGRIERIRINSPLITEAFRTVMGKEVSPLGGSIMIRPFKAILAYEFKLRDYTRRLQDMIAARGNANHAGSPSNSQEDGRPARSEQTSSNSPKQAHQDSGAPAVEIQAEMVAHLTAFLDFIDDRLAHELERHHMLRNPSTKLSASFDELWSLFQPGDFVYNPAEQQVCQVVAVWGGRQVLRYKEITFIHGLSNGIREVTASAKSKDPQANPNPLVDEDLSPFQLFCHSFVFKETEVGPQPCDFLIETYQGVKEVDSLRVIPLSCLTEEVRQKLWKRGQRYAEYATSKDVVHKAYHGLSRGKVRQQIDSDIIIDLELWSQYNPDLVPPIGLHDPPEPNRAETVETYPVPCYCSDRLCTHMETPQPLYDDGRVDKKLKADFFLNNQVLARAVSDNQAQLIEEYALLLPSKIWGFCLRDRNWAQLDIDLITDFRDRQQSFKDLVLPREHKRLVESLVSTHARAPKQPEGSEAQANSNAKNRNDFKEDLVSGKGKGCIILLHGVPGVGKTSTAECVAEYTNRPLFALTCGDMGVTASAVQKELERAFVHAHRWGCVMLLDEADVFLQTRDREDLRRNSVVSVFLRTLEYYSGILFLTTNKVGTFDEAFKSRISISLYYRELDKQQTMEIWEVNLRRLSERGITFDQPALLEWAAKTFKSTKKHPDLRRWNGRQIHNACQTAAALATFESGGVMTTAHLDSVAKASHDFDLYLKATHGTDDFGRASRGGDRGDEQYETAFSNRVGTSVVAASRSTPTRAVDRTPRRTPRAAEIPVQVDSEEDSDSSD